MNPYERAIRAEMPPRVDVGAAATQIRDTFQNPDTQNPFPFANLSASYTKEEAGQLYQDSKGERYGLALIYNDLIIRHAISIGKHIPPYGLVGQLIDDNGRGTHELYIIEDFGENPYEELYNGLSTTLIASRDLLIDRMDSQGKGSGLLKKTVVRMRDWQTFCDVNISHIPQNGGLYTRYPSSVYFQQVFPEDGLPGSMTGISLMTGLAELVPRKLKDYKVKPDPKTALRVLESGYRIIAELASLNLHSSSPLIEQIILGKRHDGNEEDGFYASLKPLESENFVLNYDEIHGITLELNPYLWEWMKKYLEETKLESGETLTGNCPVLSKVDGVSPMRLLWDRVLEYADVIYQQELKKNAS